MSRSSSPKRGRGRPRREYRIRVRGERREHPDYGKLARALLEHAAMEEARRHAQAVDGDTVAASETDGADVAPRDAAIKDGDADD